MSKPAFFIHIQSTGVQGEVHLNDAPILPLWLHHEQDAYPTVSEWVLNGENKLSVHVHESGEGAALHIALCSGQLGEDPFDVRGNQLLSLDWPPAPAVPDLPAPSMPPLLSITGEVAQTWGEWLWQKAPPFVGDKATVDALATYIRDLHATLAAGSMDALIANSQVKINEVSPIYDLDPADGPPRMLGAWAHLQGLPGFRIADFDPADLDLRVRCGGQLIEPVTLEGRPIIRQDQPRTGGRWSMPIFIARTHWSSVAGQLGIFR